MLASQIQEELRKVADKNKAIILARFFKTGIGEYGYGDKFLGVTVPKSRKIVKQFKKISLIEIQKLLQSVYHEDRLVATLILVEQFKENKENIYNFYLKNLNHINNWDLVDLSADKIVGEYLFFHQEKLDILDELVISKNLWERRIAVIATFAFIKHGYPEETLRIAEKLLNDKHDLIHKAVGWMLREVGKRCSEDVEKNFLDIYATKMPRTMLRYAIERFGDGERLRYLKIV